jgi:hypothetical protein
LGPALALTLGAGREVFPGNATWGRVGRGPPVVYNRAREAHYGALETAG